MGFDPKQHLRKLKGKDYMDCRDRVRWMRSDHLDAQIDTEVLYHDLDKHEIMIKATVVLPATGARATGICMGALKEFPGGYAEKAETQAIGRALALLGYGTEYCGDELGEGEGEGKLADSPVAPARYEPAPTPIVPLIHVDDLLIKLREASTLDELGAIRSEIAPHMATLSDADKNRLAMARDKRLVELEKSQKVPA